METISVPMHSKSWPIVPIRVLRKFLIFQVSPPVTAEAAGSSPVARAILLVDWEHLRFCCQPPEHPTFKILPR